MQLWHIIEGEKVNLIATEKYFASSDKSMTGMTLSSMHVVAPGTQLTKESDIRHRSEAGRNLRSHTGR